MSVNSIFAQRRSCVASLGAFTLLLAAVIFGTLGSTAHGAPFYEGKTIRVIVGSPPGGGYDAYARVLARHMGKHIPGNPKFIVLNMPGAGGVIAANYIYNVAKPDGLTFGTFSRGEALLPLLGEKAAKFNALKFTWLGTSSSYKNDAYVLVARPDLPYKSIKDLLKPGSKLNVASTGVGSSANDVTSLLKALGVHLHIITGYKGTADMNLAIDRKEVDGRTMGLSAIRVSHKDWLEQGKMHILVQFARATRHPDLPNVPTARELAKNPKDLALVKFAEMPFFMARPYAAPPGVPADRAKILRAAFMKTQADPEYLKDVGKFDLDISPKSGEQVEAMLKEIYASPPEVVARYKKVLGIKK